MLAGREVDEPIDSAADPDGAPRLDVVDQKLGRVPGLGPLSD